jgi:hypothetical protein
MRNLRAIAILCTLSLISVGCGVIPGTSSAAGILTGFAFTTSDVISSGTQAKLPAGTKIYPPGSTITGTDGCPTNPQHTDGEIVAVLDYTGRATAGSVTVTRHPATGGSFADAPYYLDLNPGRTLQFLGPIFVNGSYDVAVSYDYNQGAGNKTSGSFVLNRACKF